MISAARRGHVPSAGRRECDMLRRVLLILSVVGLMGSVVMWVFGFVHPSDIGPYCDGIALGRWGLVAGSYSLSLSVREIRQQDGTICTLTMDPWPLICTLDSQ